MTRWVPDKNFPLTIPNYRYVKLKLETEILARQLKPRYFLLEVAKAIAGPVAVLGLMWTIVVGISQQGALQQSKEDERFDKAVTRLAGPSPTERLTRCGPSVAPTPPANSRNFVPSPPTANPVRARFPVDCSATTAPVEELRLRSSSYCGFDRVSAQLLERRNPLVPVDDQVTPALLGTEHHHDRCLLARLSQRPHQPPLPLRLADAQMFPAPLELVKLQLHRRLPLHYAPSLNSSFATAGEVCRKVSWDQSDTPGTRLSRTPTVVGPMGRVPAWAQPAIRFA